MILTKLLNELGNHITKKEFDKGSYEFDMENAFINVLIFNDVCFANIKNKITGRCFYLYSTDFKNEYVFYSQVKSIILSYVS